jgi:hypothetical protein
MRFRLTGDFDAENVDDAFQKVAEHFTNLSSDFDATPVFDGEYDFTIMPFGGEPEMIGSAGGTAKEQITLSAELPFSHATRTIVCFAVENPEWHTPPDNAPYATYFDIPTYLWERIGKPMKLNVTFHAVEGT